MQRERVAPRAILQTPAGETVVDFGQEITGYVELTIEAKAGEVVELLHGEVLDREGNFYNGNYRSAKAQLRYVCRDGKQSWHPRLTFFGFRYVLLKEYPVIPKPDQFTAVAVRSDIMKECGACALCKGKKKMIRTHGGRSRRGYSDSRCDCGYGAGAWSKSDIRLR